MAKLNQILAVEKGIKSRVYAEVSELHKASQKPDLFNGFSKTYEPNDDDGERLASEKKRVQYVATEVLRQAERGLGELMQIEARKDYTNCTAIASVVLDGQTIIKDAPATFLLFLEKQLTDLRTFIDKLPILDESEVWSKDVNSGLYKTESLRTHRTKKKQKPIVLFPATPEHPAQTQLITEDEIVGFWNQVKISGALPKPDRQKLVERVEALLLAIKQAREAANMQDEVKVGDVGSAIFDYLFADGIVS